MSKRNTDKKRWSSTDRKEKAKKPKADKVRWFIQLKKVKDVKEAHKKLRQKKAANRLKLVEKGVVKAAAAK